MATYPLARGVYFIGSVKVMPRYLTDRKERTIAKYGLFRRTEAVVQQFRRFSLPEPCIMLDIGTADGLMLRNLIASCGVDRCIGIGVDMRLAYLKSAKQNVRRAVQADGRWLPLCARSVDVIFSTAVFKHVKGLDSLLVECRRVLKPGGILIATDPTPLGIRLGILLGHFSRRSIVQVLNLQDTHQLLTRCGFKVLHSERFMLSPIPFTGSDTLERALKGTLLDQVFFGQVICAESPRQNLALRPRCRE